MKETKSEDINTLYYTLQYETKKQIDDYNSFLNQILELIDPLQSSTISEINLLNIDLSSSNYNIIDAKSIETFQNFLSSYKNMKIKNFELKDFQNSFLSNFKPFFTNKHTDLSTEQLKYICGLLKSNTSILIIKNRHSTTGKLYKELTVRIKNHHKVKREALEIDLKKS